MAYTDVADLRLALNPGGGQDSATASEMSEDALADAIAEAQARVDSRLAGQYTVPFADGQVPAVIAQLTRDVAAYFATLTHRKSQPLADDHPVRLRYAEATALLDALADGDAQLPGVGTEAAGDVVVANVNEDAFFVMSDFDLGPTPSVPPPYPSPYW